MAFAHVEVDLFAPQTAGGEGGRRRFKLGVAGDADGSLGPGELNHEFLSVLVTFHAHAVGVDVRLVGRAFKALGDELHGAGMVHAERPLDDVEVMGAPVAVFAGAIFPEAAPAAAVVAENAFLVVRPPRGRAEPAVVVEIGRDGLGGEREGRGELAEAGADARDVADEAVADEFGGFAKRDLGALLHAGLENAAVLAGGVDQHATLAQREGDGFLDVDIFAGEHGGAGDRSMPVIGRGDEHDVDIGAGDEILILRIDLHALVGAFVLVGGVGFFDAVAGLDGLAAPDVGDREDAAIVPAEEGADVAVANQAVADEADSEAVARGVFAKEGRRENIRGDGVGEDAGEAALDRRATGEGSDGWVRHEVKGLKTKTGGDTTGWRGGCAPAGEGAL